MLVHLLKDCHLQQGYQRAKSTLQTNYGKANEIASHVQHIMQLLVTTSGFRKEPGKSLRILWKVSDSLKALAMMGKLQEINYIVCLLINKVPGIRAEQKLNKRLNIFYDFYARFLFFIFLFLFSFLFIYFFHFCIFYFFFILFLN